MSLISIIIPAFNEEKNIPLLVSELRNVTCKTNYTVEIIFINDGSTDNSADILRNLSSCDANLFFINFSRNFGQQSALRAGYIYAKGNAVICMDADLQNPPEIILEMLKKWEEGNEVVVCKRKNGKQNGNVFKEASSKLFYHIFRYFTENKGETNCPDFRLLDRKLVNIINSLPENDMFLRGIIPWMGFNTAVCVYDHGHRINGDTKYSLMKMIKLATTGVTGFSVRPLHLAIYIGLFFSCLSLLYIPYVFVRFFYGHTISGWSSLIVTVTFLGGLQLLILGVIGLYLGKLFMQMKQRPDYIIKDTNFHKL